MPSRTFKDPIGDFTLPIVVVGGYHFVEIQASKIDEQLPSVLKSITVQPGSTEIRPMRYLTLHWSAGSYTTPFKAYQISVKPDSILINLYAIDWDAFSHTWKRNGQNMALSLLSMGGAVDRKTGLYQFDILKQPQMLDIAAKTAAHVLHHYRLPLTTITDHAAWAKKDGYKGLRWDIRKVMSANRTTFDEIYSKANVYLKSLQNPKQVVQESIKVVKNQNEKNIKDAPPVCKSDTPFTDVDCNMWFADAVQEMYDLGILTGSKGKDGGFTFNPTKPLTRAEFAVAMSQMIKKLDLKK